MATGAKLGERGPWVLAVDVGGTFIKSGIVPMSADGQAGNVTVLPETPVDSTADGATILASFERTLNAALDVAQNDAGLMGVGIAMPDPFNYNTGVSLMEHKFAGIKDKNLGDELRHRVSRVRSAAMWFRHDANSFLVGEMWKGAAKGYRRVIGITLGTGLGTAACVDGALVVDEKGCPTDAVSLWRASYRGGIAEDAVSTRAILGQWSTIHADYDTSLGVKGVADAAIVGDADAKRIFTNFGSDLGHILAPLATSIDAQAILIGGQIAKARDLFYDGLMSVLGKLTHQPRVCISELGAEAQLYGAAVRDVRSLK